MNIDFEDEQTFSFFFKKEILFSRELVCFVG